MSKAALYLFDRKFIIYNLQLSFQKPYDDQLSYPIHNTVGRIRFVLNPYKTSDVISAALSNNQVIDGQIHVYDRFGHQKLRNIEFFNAYVVRFEENYNQVCNPSLINTVILYPGIININNASKHKTPWNDWLHGDKESSKKNKTPIILPTPTIRPHTMGGCR